MEHLVGLLVPISFSLILLVDYKVKEIRLKGMLIVLLVLIFLGSTVQVNGQRNNERWTEDLAKTNSEISKLEKITPEEYYQREMDRLTKQRMYIEKRLEEE